MLDADEYIMNGSENEIRTFIETQQGIGRIRLRDAFMQAGEVRESQAIISRLLPRGTYYEGAIHEQVISSLPLINTTIEVYHDGYLLQNKSDRNIKLLLSAIENEPSDAYLLFQLAKEYRMLLKHDIADGYFEKCYGLLDRKDGFRPLVVVDYIYNVFSNQNFEIGLRIIENENENLSKS